MFEDKPVIPLVDGDISKHSGFSLLRRKMIEPDNQCLCFTHLRKLPYRVPENLPKNSKQILVNKLSSNCYTFSYYPLSQKIFILST